MNVPVSQSFYQQIAANRRRSLVLVFILTALLGVFGFVIGYAMSAYVAGRPGRGDIAVVIALLLTSVSYFAGDSIVLGASGARQVDDASRSAADERRARDVARREPAAAARLRDQRHRPQRLRHRPRSQARHHRGDDRPAREARSRGVAGGHRPRAVARPQPRHPLHPAGGGAGRLDRAAGRLLPALHVLGRVGRPPRSGQRRRRRGERW